MPLQSVTIGGLKQLLKNTDGTLAKECCCTGDCLFTVFFALDWPGNTDLDAYLKYYGAPGDTPLPTVYYDHLSEGPFTLNADAHPGGAATPAPPEIILSGSFPGGGTGVADPIPLPAGVEVSFWAWYNWFSGTGDNTTESQHDVQVRNDGLNPICVTYSISGAAEVSEEVAPGDTSTAINVIRASTTGNLGSTDPTTLSNATFITVKCAACPAPP